ncbi:hypothetical protein NPIL_607601 [Nephila pilipes]|uniref:Uncharacterized protein n=1 Tax=Nephila pilipes TaxID=299642 RepID=A0A8X6I1W9_NEPPI|nr:hypothetical protein NPIL_607601 [Nephila pilipes]
MIIAGSLIQGISKAWKFTLMISKKKEIEEYQNEEYQNEEYQTEEHQNEEYQIEEYQIEEYQNEIYQNVEYQIEEYQEGISNFYSFGRKEKQRYEYVF